MRIVKKLSSAEVMERLIFPRTIGCLILAVILSIDLFYVRSEADNCVVAEIVIRRKQDDKIKTIDLKTSEIRLLSATKETIRKIQVGERIEIHNSFILGRAVSVKRQHDFISQRNLPGNLLIFILNIFLIVGFIDGLVNMLLKTYRSKATYRNIN